MKLNIHKKNILLYFLTLLLIVLQSFWCFKNYFNAVRPNKNIETIFNEFNNNNKNKLAELKLPDSICSYAANKQYSKIKELETNGHHYLIYNKDLHGYTEPIYWSNAAIYLPQTLINANDTVSQVISETEYYTFKKQSLTYNEKNYVVIVLKQYYKGYLSTSKHLFGTWFSTHSELENYNLKTINNKTSFVFAPQPETKPYYKYCIIFTLLLGIVALYFRAKFYERAPNIWFTFLFWGALIPITFICVYITHNTFWDNNYIWLCSQIALFFLAYNSYINKAHKASNLLLLVIAISVNLTYLYTKETLINILDLSNYSLYHIAFLMALTFGLTNIYFLTIPYLNNIKWPFIGSVSKLSPLITRFFVISFLGTLIIYFTNTKLQSNIVKNELINITNNVHTANVNQSNNLKNILSNFANNINLNDIDYYLQNTLTQQLDNFASVANVAYNYTLTKDSVSETKYIYKQLLKLNNNDSLYINVQITNKQNANNTISDELFTNFNSNQSALYNCNYAIYENYYLLLKNNNIDAPLSIKASDTFIKENNFNFLEAANNFSILYNIKKWSWLSFLSSFSYIFIFLLCLSGLFFISTKSLVNIYFNNITLPQKIFSIISAIVVVSFIIISSFIIKSFNVEQIDNNGKQLSNAAQILISEIKANISSQKSDDAITLYDLSVNENLKKLMLSISALQSSDINVYNKNGLLEVSTQPYIFNGKFISPLMNFNALNALKNKKLEQFLTFETIGDLSFQSIYLPITDNNKNVFAYINIPHYASNKNFEKELNNFMATVINIMAFVLIIALLIGYYFSALIAKPLVAIAQRMANTNIKAYNPPLEYKSNDEIGQLVNQYNNMQQELYKSIQKLAKDERETAWRQMAKQVAHEIKNPLTPMKLKIQLLERNISLNRGNLHEMVSDTNALLIDQINHLSKIASDFSEFAQIENSTKLPLNITNIITPTVALHHIEGKVNIAYLNNANHCIINADETQINRLFINLIKNAIEACENNEVTEIIITQNIIAQKVVIEIIDNGPGIPEDILNKIFSPNFTTKSSGTGLGLAMCKTIIEQHKGEISFVTSPNGTTFTLIFPLL